MLYNYKIALKKKLGQNNPFFIILEKSFDSIKSLIPYQIRLFPEFQKFVRFLNESQYWSKQKLDEYQYEKTLELLKYAQKNIEWYGRKFAEYGISFRDLINLDDIKKFPTVSKEDIRDNLEKFISKEINKKKLMYVTTGGSTAIPFGFYQPFNLEKIDYAFYEHQWSWFDCHIFDKSVVFRGEYVGSESKLFDYKASKNEWRFSTYYLNEKNFIKYFEKLNKIKPKFIQAYPSAAEIFAKFMIDKKLELNFKPNTILLGSENIYDDQISLIEKAFNSKVHNYYGQAERVCLASWTKNSRLFHVFPQYGLTELIDSDGNEVIEEDQIGEIVATGFYNFAMPFIRYRTRDLATHTNQKSPDGFEYRLFKKINGRLQELFVTSNGRLISMTAINMHDETFDNVKQFQFYQDTPGKLILRIIPKDNLSEKDLTRIYDNLKVKVGNDTQLEIQIVDKLEKSSSGKLRFLIQKLKIDHWNKIETI